MITKDNLKECFDMLTEDDVNKVMTSKKDYVIFELCSTNAMSAAYCTPADYDEEEAQAIVDNGDVYCDKDDFLRLFEESESVNPFLIEWM
jgi:hypothetical protein